MPKRKRKKKKSPFERSAEGAVARAEMLEYNLNEVYYMVREALAVEEDPWKQAGFPDWKEEKDD